MHHCNKIFFKEIRHEIAFYHVLCIDLYVLYGSVETQRVGVMSVAYDMDLW